ncbi:hypothetical protein AQUCO_13600005v1 [Aquilegia coerulea]|uniref:F-box domain-containing protein n=1 Tax=Aquilegia coerulea TaxID=218851 RepID=A0A2G5C138_AQUCA|nr:hypothetical protein AQUCO_13600005v1 [Aquilegia coerulea]
MTMKRPCFVQNIPEEIMSDIFSRLPIRDLFQCQLVCKDWYTNWTKLVSNPFLVNLHHSRINPDQDGSNFLIKCCSRSNICRVPFSKLCLVDHENYKTTLKTAFNIKFRLPLKQMTLVGSANGLLCLCLLPDEEIYYICNPITREVLKLPRACGLDMYLKKEISCSATPSGFVFDATTNTYKVIRTWYFADEIYGDTLLKTGVEIYTLGSGRWRRVNNIPTCFSYTPETMQVFVNGALHWHIYCQPDSEFYNCVGAKDIKSENFRAFKKPPDYGINKKRTLGVLKDYLCLMDDTIAGELVLWTMKDYGIENSWSKEYIVQKEVLAPLRIGPFKILRTVKQQQSVLFHGNEEFGCYDVRKGEFKHVRVDGIPWYFEEFEAVVHL